MDQFHYDFLGLEWYKKYSKIKRVTLRIIFNGIKEEAALQIFESFKSIEDNEGKLRKLAIK